jgi:hypothetical protein
MRRAPSSKLRAGADELVQAQLLFGRDIMGRAMVSEEEWRRFLDAEVTPRFPEGFSVTDLSGQYRDKAGVIVREQSKQVLVVIHGGSADEAKLAVIRDAYKRRFQQEAVLLIETPICAGF